MISIVLADDHVIVRHGIKCLLESEPDVKVVGETGNGVEVLKIVEKVKPDILISDIMMNGMNGIDVARQVKDLSPSTAIIVLSMYSNEAYVVAALRSGVQGYVTKTTVTDELITAVREVLKGHRFLSSELSEKAYDLYARFSETQSDDKLTVRELEIFQLVAQGYSNEDIAETLFISRRTVETHRAHLMHKLGVRNHEQLVHYAIAQGIIPSFGKEDEPSQQEDSKANETRWKKAVETVVR